MKILLTGGAGFIASHIAQIYLKASHQLFIIDKKPPSSLPNLLKGQVNYFRKDLSKSGVDQIFEKVKPDIVNHHAALISVTESFENPLKYQKHNVCPTLNLLKLSAHHKVRQFIFASSVAVYGDNQLLPIPESASLYPQSFYGQNKYSCENYINLYQSQLRISIFRYANVYGPRQNASAEGGVVAIFCQNLSQNEKSNIYGNGRQTRDFVYVEDVAKANLIASQAQFSGLVNISSNTQISINRLYQKLKTIAQSNLNPIYKPKRGGEIDQICLDNQKAHDQLGWSPQTSFNKGLEKTYNYFVNQKL